MKIAVEQNGAFVVDHYSKLFPHVSFPEQGPDAAWISENALPVNEFKPHDHMTQKLEVCAPYLENGTVFTMQVVDKSEQELAEELNAVAYAARFERNAKLAACDWTQLADAPLDAEQRAAWGVYRQELRDISAQPGFPREVVWPKMP